MLLSNYCCFFCTFAAMKNLNVFFIIYIIAAFLSLPTLCKAQTVECEDTCSHIHGIDISHYQGNVFWETLGENSHVAYVYIKASEGGNRIDSRYENNIKTAKQYGIKVGSYHFYRAKTSQQEQLENFLIQCHASEQDLLPMIDVETTSGLSTEAFCDSLFEFLELVEMAYRQRPLIYTGTNFYNKHLSGKLDRYLVMIAQYTKREPELNDGRDITMWQYTGKGHISGINGYVDKSRFMGTHNMRDIRFRHRKGEDAPSIKAQRKREQREKEEMERLAAKEAEESKQDNNNQ